MARALLIEGEAVNHKILFINTNRANIMDVVEELQESAIKAEVQAEITHELYASNTKSLIVACIVACTLAYIQASVIPKRAIYVWLALFAAAYLARHSISTFRKRNIFARTTPNQWLLLFRVCTTACGTAWGFAGIFLFPVDNVTHQAFLTLILAGVCGGAIIVYSVDKLTSFGFVGAMIFLALPSFLFSGNTISVSMAIMLILFAVYTTIAGLSNGRLVKQSIQHKIQSLYAQKNIEVLSQRQKLHIENTPLGVIEWDVDFKVRSWNAAAESIFGYTAAEAIGQQHLFIVHQSSNEQVSHIMNNLKQNTGQAHLENENVRKDGKVIFCAWFNTPIINSQNEVIGFASLVQDKTAAKEAQDEIQQLAYFDTLTNLPNRRLLQDRLDQAQETSARNKSYACSMFIDLDNFKALNDSKGHATGDLLLQEVAARLKKLIRGNDTVARIGGDEFVLIFSNLGKTVEEAELASKHIAEKIILAIGKPYMLNNTYHRCTPSLGMCLFLGKKLKNSEILKRADHAMYEVKHSGRNNFKLFDEATQPLYEMRSNLKNSLQDAISEAQFELHYQVQVNAAGMVNGAEALIRWHHPQYGLVSPAEFIPLAEESGQIILIGAWVISQACQQLKKWENSTKTNKLVLSVNVSAIQFAQIDFVAKVTNMIKDSGCQAKLLTLELTESTILQNIEDVIIKMQELKKLGVGLSMDDFGVGYSSFSALKRLPIDELKIDQSFIQDSLDNATNATNATIVKSLISLGKDIGLNVVAEGVETESQARFLRSCFCKSFQGYLYGRPTKIDNFEHALE